MRRSNIERFAVLAKNCTTSPDLDQTASVYAGRANGNTGHAVDVAASAQTVVARWVISAAPSIAAVRPRSEPPILFVPGSVAAAATEFIRPQSQNWHSRLVTSSRLFIGPH